jgi:hypothetical protein
LDRIYHPNIDTTSGLNVVDEGPNVCVSLLDEWDKSMDLDHIVMALLFLMYNPAFDDALSPYFDGCDLTDDDDVNAMCEHIRQTLKGGEVEGFDYDRLLPEDYTDDNNNDERTVDNAGDDADADKDCSIVKDNVTNNGDAATGVDAGADSEVTNTRGGENDAVSVNTNTENHNTHTAHNSDTLSAETDCDAQAGGVDNGAEMQDCVTAGATGVNVADKPAIICDNNCADNGNSRDTTCVNLTERYQKVLNAACGLHDVCIAGLFSTKRQKDRLGPFSKFWQPEHIAVVTQNDLPEAVHVGSPVDVTDVD